MHCTLLSCWHFQTDLALTRTFCRIGFRHSVCEPERLLVLISATTMSNYCGNGEQKECKIEQPSFRTFLSACCQAQHFQSRKSTNSCIEFRSSIFVSLLYIGCPFLNNKSISQEYRKKSDPWRITGSDKNRSTFSLHFALNLQWLFACKGFF